MATTKLTEKDKQKLIDKLSKNTGINPRRCKTFLEKFNWDKIKTYEDPLIKSAIQKNQPKHEEKEIPPIQKEEKAKTTPKQQQEKKKKKTSGKESEKTTKLHPTKKRRNGGIEYEVEIIGDREFFNGKEIKADGSGFYHPYATMKQIMDWVKKYGPGSKKK